MWSNKNKCFLFGGFKKFAILKYNMKTPAFRRTTDPVRGYIKNKGYPQQSENSPMKVVLFGFCYAANLKARSCTVCNFFCTEPSIMALNFFSSPPQVATF